MIPALQGSTPSRATDADMQEAAATFSESQDAEEPDPRSRGTSVEPSLPKREAQGAAAPAETKLPQQTSADGWLEGSEEVGLPPSRT